MTSSINLPGIQTERRSEDIYIYMCGYTFCHVLCKWLILDISDSKVLGANVGLNLDLSPLWTQNWNLMTILFALILDSCDQIMSQFCICHNSSWAVVACAKLWHDLIITFHTGTIFFNKIWIISSYKLREMDSGPLGTSGRCDGNFQKYDFQNH